MTMIVDSTVFGRDGWRRAEQKNIILVKSDTQITRDSLVVTPCRHALRGAKTTPLVHPPDAQMTRLTRAIFGCQKKSTQNHDDET